MRIKNPQESLRLPRLAHLLTLDRTELIRIYSFVCRGWTTPAVLAWPVDRLATEIVFAEIGPRELCGHADPTGNLLCSNGAYEIHGIHRYEIDAEGAEPTGTRYLAEIAAAELATITAAVESAEAAEAAKVGRQVAEYHRVETERAERIRRAG